MNADFVGDSGDVDEAELFFDSPNRHRQIAYPVFVDGTPINPDGRIDIVDRRQELAQLVVNSEEFASATVSQLWKKLLGDSVNASTGRFAQQQLVQGLAEQFAAHGFEQRDLMKWILLSDANLRPEIRDASAPIYESVATALRDVSRQGRPVSPTEAVLFARVDSSRAARAGDSSIFVRSSDSGSSETASASAFVRRMTASDMPHAVKVQHIFLHTLARRPTPQESSAAQQMLSAHEGNSAAALDDIWWAITNCAEYAKRQ